MKYEILRETLLDVDMTKGWGLVTMAILIIALISLVVANWVIDYLNKTSLKVAVACVPFLLFILFIVFPTFAPTRMAKVKYVMKVFSEEQLSEITMSKENVQVFDDIVVFIDVIEISTEDCTKLLEGGLINEY